MLVPQNWLGVKNDCCITTAETSYEPQEAGSMMAFCINGKSKTFSELFMSHPPLDKRIEALRSGQYLK